MSSTENSEFERREQARRESKVTQYNQIAAERARWLSKPTR